MYLGDYISIDREIGPFEFECSSVSTGTPFYARVDEDKRELFLDTTWIQEHPAACRFLRPSGERIVCTIHEYKCSTVQILPVRGFPGVFPGKEVPWNSDRHPCIAYRGRGVTVSLGDGEIGLSSGNPRMWRTR